MLFLPQILRNCSERCSGFGLIPRKRRFHALLDLRKVSIRAVFSSPIFATFFNLNRLDRCERHACNSRIDLFVTNHHTEGKISCGTFWVKDQSSGPTLPMSKTFPSPTAPLPGNSTRCARRPIHKHSSLKREGQLAKPRQFVSPARCVSSASNMLWPTMNALVSGAACLSANVVVCVARPSNGAHEPLL